MKTLATKLTLQSLRQMAEIRFFERGQDYFDHGQVGPLTERKEVVKATVTGSSRLCREKIMMPIRKPSPT